MTAVSQLLAEVRLAGASLIPLPDGRLKWRAPSPLPEPLLVRLSLAKQDLLDALSDKPDTDRRQGDLAADEWKARFDERASIRENDGGIPRALAEELAWDDVLGEWHRTHPMEFPARQCAGCAGRLGESRHCGCQTAIASISIR